MSEAEYMMDCDAENWDVSDAEYYGDAIDQRLAIAEEEACRKSIQEHEAAQEIRQKRERERG